MLEGYQIIQKEKLPHNKKTIIYVLTEKGLNLSPSILELALWTYGNIGELNSDLAVDDQLKSIKENKEEFIKTWIENYREKNWLLHNV